MPLYRCTISEGLTTYEQRLEIAKEITRIHCEVTGAPPVFVHAFFVEDRAGMMAESTRAIVIGSIRAGRTSEQRERIVSHIKDAFARVCGVEVEKRFQIAGPARIQPVDHHGNPVKVFGQFGILCWRVGWLPRQRWPG